MPNSNGNTPKTQEERLLARVVAGAPSIPQISIEDPDRFAYEVRKALENRAYQNWTTETQTDKNDVVFVYVEYPRSPSNAVNNTCTLKNIRDLPIAGQPVFGRMFFLDSNASNGTFIDIPVPIDDLDPWLEKMDLDANPIVTAYKDQLKMAYRPQANGSTVRYFTIRETEPELSIEELTEALEHFHRDNVVSPTMCDSGIWQPECADKYIPAKNTEKEIQKRMRTALSSWFHGLVRAETEDKVPTGRVDIRLMFGGDESQDGLKYWSIIELKVVRSFGNHADPKKAKKIGPQVNINAVIEGFSQANDFTTSREVKEGFLEVFDMRKIKDDLLSHDDILAVHANCNAKINPKLRAMYGSSKEARTAGFLYA